MTGRIIGERLLAEAETSVSLRVAPLPGGTLLCFKGGEEDWPATPAQSLRSETNSGETVVACSLLIERTPVPSVC